MNYKKLLRIALVVIGIALMLTLLGKLFEIFGEETSVSTNTALTSESIILLALLFSLALNKQRYYYYRKRVRNATKADASLLKDYVGKNAVVTTAVNVFYGTIVEVEGDYIKIKDRDMRPTFHILKSTMIISIKIK